MSDGDLQYLTQLSDLYLAGNYPALLDEVERRISLPTPFEAWQLILIGAQREELSTGLPLSQFLREILEENTRNDSHLHALLMLVQGKMSLQKALQRGTDAEYMAKCYYYHSAHLRTVGQPVEAIEFAEKCIATKSASWERRLAIKELRLQLWKYFVTPDEKLYHGVPHLLWQAMQSIIQGKHVQGRTAADEAETRLNAVQDARELEFAMLASDLAAINMRLKSRAKAVKLLQLALEEMIPRERQYPAVVLGLVDKLRSFWDAQKPDTYLTSQLVRAVGLQRAIDNDAIELVPRLESFSQAAAQLGQLTDAIVAVQEAIALREENSEFAHEDRRLYSARRFLVGLLHQTGDVAAAVKELLNLVKNGGKFSSEDRWRDLTIAAFLAQQLGISEQDLGALRDTLEQLPADQSKQCVHTNYRIATLFQMQGRHWDAIRILRNLSAMQLDQKEQGIVRIAMAQSYREVGDTHSALACIDQCKRIADTGALSNSELAAAYTVEAELAYDSGDRTLGDNAIERACRLAEGDPRQELSIVNVVTGYYGPRGNYEALALWLNEATKRAGEADSPTLLNNLGLAAMYSSQLDKAKSIFERALSGAEGEKVEHHSPALLMNYAKLFLLQGEMKKGQLWMTKAIEQENRIIASMMAAASSRQRLMFLEKMRESFETYLSLMLSQPEQDRDAASVLRVVLQRKGLDFEAITSRRRILASPAGARIQERLAELASLQEQCIAGRWPAFNEYATTQTPVDDVAGRIEQLEHEIAHHWSQIAASTVPFEITADDVTSRLAPDEALLEYVYYRKYDFSRPRNCWGRGRYAVLIVRGRTSGPMQVLDLGEAESIDSEIRLLVMHVAGPSSPNAFRDLTPNSSGSTTSAAMDSISRLSKRIIWPFSAAMDGVRRVRIATDGQLSLLPFDLLQIEPGRSIVDSFHVDYLTTSRQLCSAMKQAERSKNTDLVVAAPDFNLRIDQNVHSQYVHDSRLRDTAREALRDGRSEFASLKGAIEEGKEISGLLGCELWHGADALDGRIKKLSSPRVFHLATHGFFQSRQKTSSADQSPVTDFTLAFPCEAGLALAGANTFLAKGMIPEEAEDGFLFADEIALMDLANTELVTLSACESGVGTVLYGEGVTGLRRAFLAAGARCLVVSLWQIPDIETVEFMSCFYREIVGGKTCGESLWAAKNALRDKSDSSPGLWAAFICVGDPDTRLERD